MVSSPRASGLDGTQGLDRRLLHLWPPDRSDNDCIFLAKTQDTCFLKVIYKNLCDLWCLTYEKACVELKSNVVIRLLSHLY